MEKTELQDLISEFGLQDQTWIRPYYIHSIILANTGNQFYNPKIQKIRFNSSNDVLEIKYSELMYCSSLLNRFSYDYDTKTIFVESCGTVYFKKFIREPKIGDKVGAYDPKLKSYTYSTITRIIYNIGRTDFVLADSAVVGKIKTTTYGLRFFIILGDVSSAITLNIPTNFYIEKDVTDYTADIFIAYSDIAGIETSRAWC